LEKGGRVGGTQHNFQSRRKGKKYQKKKAQKGACLDGDENGENTKGGPAASGRRGRSYTNNDGEGRERQKGKLGATYKLLILTLAWADGQKRRPYVCKNTEERWG